MASAAAETPFANTAPEGTGAVLAKARSSLLDAKPIDSRHKKNLKPPATRYTVPVSSCAART